MTHYFLKNHPSSPLEAQSSLTPDDTSKTSPSKPVIVGIKEGTNYPQQKKSDHNSSTKYLIIEPPHLFPVNFSLNEHLPPSPKVSSQNTFINGRVKYYDQYPHHIK